MTAPRCGKPLTSRQARGAACARVLGHPGNCQSRAALDDGRAAWKARLAGRPPASDGRCPDCGYLPDALGHQVSCEWPDLDEDAITIPDGAYALDAEDAVKAARACDHYATSPADRDMLLAMCGLVGATPVPATAPASGRRAWPDQHRRTTKPRGRP